MKANPGGSLRTGAIIGRDEEVERLLNRLEVQSVRLTSERRIGKTTMLRKIASEPPKGWTPLLCLLESKHHPIECVQTIYEEAKEAEVQSPTGTWKELLKDAYEKVRDTKMGGWQLPELKSDWKSRLRVLVSDIVESTDNKVLIILDEFPSMVTNIAQSKGGGPELAMEFLDAFRETCQQYEGTGQVRFILCGSIGPRLVVRQLKETAGYRGSPTNDMARESLGGMRRTDIKEMCERLLLDEGITVDNLEGFVTEMTAATDGLPLYIQHICQRIQDEGLDSVSASYIGPKLDELMDEPGVEWFEYAVDRIDSYYGKYARLAHIILEDLCHTTEYVPESDIVNTAKSAIEGITDQDVKGALSDLREDHYLDRDTSDGRRYRFRLEVIRRWWLKNRG